MGSGLCSLYQEIDYFEVGISRFECIDKMIWATRTFLWVKNRVDQGPPVLDCKYFSNFNVKKNLSYSCKVSFPKTNKEILHSKVGKISLGFL